MMKGKELNLNGIKLTAGQVTPRTRRFFESRGATVNDDGQFVTLAGPMGFSKAEADAFLEQKQREDAGVPAKVGQAQGTAPAATPPRAQEDTGGSDFGFKRGFLNRK